MVEANALLQQMHYKPFILMERHVLGARSIPLIGNFSLLLGIVHLWSSTHFFPSWLMSFLFLGLGPSSRFFLRMFIQLPVPLTTTDFPLGAGNSFFFQILSIRLASSSVTYFACIASRSFALVYLVFPQIQLCAGLVNMETPGSPPYIFS